MIKLHLLLLLPEKRKEMFFVKKAVVLLVSGLLTGLFLSVCASASMMKIDVISPLQEGFQAFYDISDNGNFLTYYRVDGTGFHQIYLYSTKTGETTIISKTPEGIPGNGESYIPRVSNGGKIVFTSKAGNIASDSFYGKQRILMYDPVNGISNVSLEFNGYPLENGHSWYPDISGDGEKVTYIYSGNLPDESDNITDSDGWNILVKDLGSGSSYCLTYDSSGQPSTCLINLYYRPRLDEDGNMMVFRYSPYMEDGSHIDPLGLFTDIAEPFSPWLASVVTMDLTDPSAPSVSSIFFHYIRENAWPSTQRADITPDGNTVIFETVYSQNQDHQGIMVAHLSEGEVLPVPDGRSSFCYDACISTDENYFCFLTALPHLFIPMDPDQFNGLIGYNVQKEEFTLLDLCPSDKSPYYFPRMPLIAKDPDIVAFTRCYHMDEGEYGWELCIRRKKTPKEAVIDIREELNEMEPHMFKDPDKKEVFDTMLGEILSRVDLELYQEALNKISSLKKKTDGCSQNGAPDHNDFIVDCDTQAYMTDLLDELIVIIEGEMQEE